MARILFTWELGGGSGHVRPYVDIITTLLTQGHEVSFALRNLHVAQPVLGDLNVRCFQAPYLLPRFCDVVLPVDCSSKVLVNNGYDHADHLSGLIAGWRNLYEVIAPDVIIFDYSPTAMLAARNWPAGRIAIGTGFHLPPSIDPLPRFDGTYDEQAHGLDRRLLAVINEAGAHYGVQPLARVSELFAADRTLLRTFPELDHYQQRREGEYVGVLPAPTGAEPQWPAAPGKRVFAYLKPFETLPALLKILHESRHSTIVHGDGIPAALEQQFDTETITFSKKPVDMKGVCRDADFAITNAGHGTAAELLLGGVPSLLLPLAAEQDLVAANVERLGAGLVAPKRAPAGMAQKISRLCLEPDFRTAAAAFADRYREFDPGEFRNRLLSAVAEKVAA
ncbi:MAG: glycosyltransferase [Gammaproteobacteria bacterium]